MDIWVGNSISDERFVSNLYNILLGREADKDGLAGKLYELSTGATREEIFLRVNSISRESER